MRTYHYKTDRFMPIEIKIDNNMIRLSLYYKN